MVCVISQKIHVWIFRSNRITIIIISLNALRGGRNVMHTHHTVTTNLIAQIIITMAEAPAMGCSVNGALPERVECILTYGGSTRDIAVNYIMLAINLAGCVMLLPPNTSSSRHALSFAFVWVFQIGLCLALAQASDDGYGCAGISIVWCAMGGWMVNQQQKKSREQPILRKRDQRPSHPLWNLLTASNIVVGVYYWITEAFITTLAHFLAVILGWLLSWLTQ